MRFDLQTLKAFVSVAEAGSIAAASAREHLVPAAISRRIADLEREAGTALLYRRARGVEPTPAGLALLHHARQVMQSLRALESELSEHAQGLKGHVRIFANTSAIVQFLPEDLGTFLERHPGVRIDLEEKTSRVAVAAVESGAADLGICAGSVPAGDLRVLPYREDRLMAVVPAGHPLARRRKVRLEEILPFDHVGLQEGSSLRDLVTEAAAALGQAIRLRVPVTSFDGLRRMVQAGHGVGILPEAAIVPYLRAMHLAAVPLDELWARRRLGICVRDLDALPLPARLLVKSLTAGAGETPASPKPARRRSHRES